jgi:hypothetical protein
MSDDQISVTTGGSTTTISWHNSLCQWQGNKVDTILAGLSTLLQAVQQMSGSLTDLQAQVANNTTVIGSAKDLIVGLKAKLDAAGTDPAKLKALSDELASTDQSLADAVAQNTPAA